LRARKRFGQHFLTDSGVLQQLVQALSLRSADRVFEIGPGHGALTDLLADEVDVYRAVEIDRDLVPLLRARHPKLDVVNADVLKVDLNEILDEGKPWRVFGNLPYNISSPLLDVVTRFINAHPGRIADLHFMLQREMAQRLTANPGSKAWGRLSVMVQLEFDVESIFDVSPQSFSPAPKVWSSVVRLMPSAAPVSQNDRHDLDRILRLAFAGRRKRLSNSLKSLNIDWSASNLDPGLRADNVSSSDYLSLVPIVRAARGDESGS